MRALKRLAVRNMERASQRFMPRDKLLECELQRASIEIAANADRARDVE